MGLGSGAALMHTFKVGFRGLISCKWSLSPLGSTLCVCETLIQLDGRGGPIRGLGCLRDWVLGLGLLGAAAATHLARAH